jgi:hypothetical protein
MKFEIITDSEDLLILLVNTRVVAISQEMSVILGIIEDYYEYKKNKKRMPYNEALIYPELDDDMYKEPEIVPIVDKIDKASPEVGSLGKLFNL